MKFEEHDTVIYSITTATDTFTKIAAFDLDDTIIKTKSGKVFAVNKDDWQLWNNEVKPILYKYYNDCYKIVIFTNQMGISRGKVNKDDFMEKVKNIQKELNLDIDVFIATADDKYRKPMTGMWDLFENLYKTKIDKKKSFYCGDAAGREKDWIKGKKKDFSNADIKFAYNIGLRFEIPENVFTVNSPVKYKSIDKIYDNLDLDKFAKIKNTIKIEPQKAQEMVILVGRPGSGKSRLSKEILDKQNFKNYEHISRDVCKTQTACMRIAKKAVADGKSVWIDNTNPDKKSRKEYIDLAKQMKMSVTVYLMDIPENLSKHMSHMRVMKGEGNKIAEVVYRVYNKRYEIPTLDEGIDKIIKIPYVYKGSKYFKYHYSI